MENKEWSRLLLSFDTPHKDTRVVIRFSIALLSYDVVYSYRKCNPSPMNGFSLSFACSLHVVSSSHPQENFMTLKCPEEAFINAL